MAAVRPAALNPAHAWRMLWLWGPVVAYMAVVYYESSLSAAPLPAGWSDKVAHLMGYVVLGVLMARALAGGFPKPLAWRMVVLAAVLTAIYGASDEWHQRSVVGRTADVLDLAYDSAGGTLGALFVWACGRLRA